MINQIHEPGVIGFDVALPRVDFLTLEPKLAEVERTVSTNIIGSCELCFRAATTKSP